MKIYIGNLSFNTTEESLKNEFSAFGDVESVNIIKDKLTGASKGFGFVEMSDEKAAIKAIEKMNGINLDGRKLRVNVSKEMPQNNNRRY